MMLGMGRRQGRKEAVAFSAATGERLVSFSHSEIRSLQEGLRTAGRFQVFSLKEERCLI